MTYLLVAFAQLAGSFLRTSSIVSVVKNDKFKFLVITAINDILFYAVTAGVTKLVIEGNYLVILAAVFGAVLGNGIAISIKR
jgi:hypothetical protein